jgi:hypothetical protein
LQGERSEEGGTETIQNLETQDWLEKTRGHEITKRVCSQKRGHDEKEHEEVERRGHLSQSIVQDEGAATPIHPEVILAANILRTEKSSHGRRSLQEETAENDPEWVG